MRVASGLSAPALATRDSGRQAWLSSRSARTPEPWRNAATAWWRRYATARSSWGRPLVLVAAFFVAPVIITLGMSLTDMATATGLSNWQWIGLDNYERIVRGQLHLLILGTRIFYVVVTLAFNVLVGLGDRAAQHARRSARRRGLPGALAAASHLAVGGLRADVDLGRRRAAVRRHQPVRRAVRRRGAVLDQLRSVADRAS